MYCYNNIISKRIKFIRVKISSSRTPNFYYKYTLIIKIQLKRSIIIKK